MKNEKKKHDGIGLHPRPGGQLADKQGTRELYETVFTTAGMFRNDTPIDADWGKKIEDDNNKQ